MAHTSERTEKQPADVVDVEIDLSRYLQGTDDYIVSATATITGPDNSLQTGGGGHNSFEMFGTPARYARLWLSGGTNKESYLVEALFVTNEGRQKEVDLYVDVLD